jgi:hypothetical protein
MTAAVEFDQTFFVSWGICVGLFAGVALMVAGLGHLTIRIWAHHRFEDPEPNWRADRV